jgi:hypothetical protein
MSRNSQNRWLAMVSRPAFVVTSAAIFLLGAANASLASILHPYARPEMLTALVATVDLARTLFNVWSGISFIC